MKVKDIMTGDPRVCTPDTTVAEAARLMWEGDCGILPVVDDGELLGVVTDRDMYIALATRNERAAALRVGAVATRTLVTCTPEDNVRTALTSMKDARVRRLPVVGFGNTVLRVPVAERHPADRDHRKVAERGGRCAYRRFAPTITRCHRSLPCDPARARQ